MRTETKTNYILIVLLYLFAFSTVLYSFEAIQSVVMILSGVFMILQFRSGKPFFTTKKGTEGTGLGLSITNDIVKAHGGTLNILTEVDKFTRFEVRIPSNNKTSYV